MAEEIVGFAHDVCFVAVASTLAHASAMPSQILRLKYSSRLAFVGPWVLCVRLWTVGPPQTFMQIRLDRIEGIGRLDTGSIEQHSV